MGEKIIKLLKSLFVSHLCPKHQELLLLILSLVLVFRFGHKYKLSFSQQETLEFCFGSFCTGLDGCFLYKTALNVVSNTITHGFFCA